MRRLFLALVIAFGLLLALAGPAAAPIYSGF